MTLTSAQIRGNQDVWQNPKSDFPNLDLTLGDLRLRLGFDWDLELRIQIKCFPGSPLRVALTPSAPTLSAPSPVTVSWVMSSGLLTRAALT